MKLSVVLGTYNRQEQLKRCVESILRETSTPCKVYITDAGSTDGTIEYLQSVASETLIPILVGEKLGQAKAYNDVFAIVDTQYVCWLSDDNEVVDQGLDRAVAVLEKDPAIGLLGLKTKDQQGPFVGTPYIGGISAAGILNVNQGMLPTSVLKQVGGFSEEFRDYGIDPALTADVLFSGYKVAYTKCVALHHYRNWSEDPASANYQWLKERHAAAKKRYSDKYCTASKTDSFAYRLKAKIGKKLKEQVLRVVSADAVRRSALARDVQNILFARYISLFDPLLSLGKNYYLVQQVAKTSVPCQK